MCRVELSFFSFLFFTKFSDFFLTKITTKYEKNKNLRPPEWPSFWPPAEQETNFFLRVALIRRGKLKRLVKTWV